MAVVEFEVTKREPYAGGRAFGDVGSYERIEGIVHYAVDPEHERNTQIVDLNLAPRDDQGRVRFYGDVCLLVPSDPTRARRRLFMELPNRGNKFIPGYIHRADTKDAETSDIPAGDAFLLRHGFTVAWVGWQWDVYRSESLMGLVAPEANGVRGTTRVRFQVNERHQTHLLAHRYHQPLPAADIVDPDATLSVRDWPQDNPRRIPRDEWLFARERDDGSVVPDNEHIYYEPGFEPGKVYEVIYATERAPIAGAGLLALRDCASFLRFSDSFSNPCRGIVDRAYCLGISQTGRMLRHFIYLGMNLDEEDRQVFDGLMPHVAGARRGEFNHRFAQPSARDWPSFGYGFPFADEPMPDPDTGIVDGMLKRQREIGGVPKIFWTNTSSEYWRGDCHLLHIDPTGNEDLSPAPETRIYAFPSTQHSGGKVPVVYTNKYGDRARYPLNVIDYSPLMRALIIHLDCWVSEGTEPPPSYHPRLSDGSAITYEEAFVRFPQIPGLQLPALERLRKLYRIDVGPDAVDGILNVPPAIGRPYPALVWNTNDDGNEASPVQTADLANPVGSHTGWNPRHPDTGAPEQAILFLGATLFFPRTADEREAAGDPRMSIEELYDSREEYLSCVRRSAKELVASRYILAEDVDLVVRDAADRYDDAMKQVNSPL